MSEIALAFAAVSMSVTGYLFWQLYRVRKATNYLIGSLKHLVYALDEQQNINEAQQQMNENIATNLEILGVHTKLVKPSIGYEASAYLAWLEKKKEENNG